MMAVTATGLEHIRAGAMVRLHADAPARGGTGGHVGINNDIYDTDADGWWDKDSFLTTLHLLNHGRFAYLDRVYAGLNRPLTGRALEVGSGGGFATEKLAKRGFQASGIDPSAQSVEAARGHAAKFDLDIDYQQGFGENLPYDDGAFDLVFCCDVLEHVDDVGQVVNEIARVLRPGGVFLFDTINRTAMSWLTMIKLAQDFSPTAILPRDLHVWSMFIKPRELKAHLKGADLACREITGFSPSRNPARLLKAALDFRKGVHPDAVGETLGMGPCAFKGMTYIGWAQKPERADG